MKYLDVSIFNKNIQNRIQQLNKQLDNPEVLDQKTIQVKIDAYKEILFMIKKISNENISSL